MNKLARVSSKGQVVIPALLRKKMKISRAVLIREEEGRIVLEPAVSLEEAFGEGGETMIKVARAISQERRREIESERP